MSAFSILLDQYKKPLFGYIFNMTKDSDLAEDIFQETFIRVIKNIESYKEQGNFKSWIFRISTNLCKDHWKRKSTDNESLDDWDEVPGHAGNVDFIDQIESEEDISWLRNEVDLLPAKLKEVLLMHTYSDMSFKEIAAELDCSINTVLGRMHYAKKHLKERWEKHHDE